MTRSIYRSLLTLLAVLGLLLCMQHLTAAAASEVTLYDEGNRLSPSEFTECENRLKQAADATGMNICVVLGTQYRSDLTIESVCKTTYTTLYGKKTDGLCYYMDLKGENPYDYIATSGLGQFYYTNSSRNNRVNLMFDELDDYLYPVGSENVPGAVGRFAELVEYYYEHGIPDDYYVYDDEYREYYHVEDGRVITTKHKPYIDWFAVIVCTMFAGMFGLLAAIITFVAVKVRYRFKRQLSPTNYVNRKTVNYREQFDNFVRTNTSRVYIDTSSGSGGGGGGGSFGHSSGGFGGGGHHR